MKVGIEKADLKRRQKAEVKGACRKKTAPFCLPPTSSAPSAIRTATCALANTATQDVAAPPRIDQSAQALSLETSPANYYRDYFYCLSDEKCFALWSRVCLVFLVVYRYYFCFAYAFCCCNDKKKLFCCVVTSDLLAFYRDYFYCLSDKKCFALWSRINWLFSCCFLLFIIIIFFFSCDYLCFCECFLLFEG